MKRTIFLMTVLSFLLLGGACSKQTPPEALELKSVSAETFTSNGGVGTIEVNRKDVQVESTQPDWLKVSVFESTILFNVWSNSSAQERTGSVLIRAEGSPDLSVTVSQAAFHGINVTPTSLTFSDDVSELSVAVVASGDFTVDFTENPGNIFSYAVENEHMVKFAVSRAQGRESFSGRAVITPSDGAEPVVVSLYLPKKSVYDYLLGTWEVASNAAQDTYPMTFRVKESQSSYYVYVDAPGLKAFPFVAEFVNGNVKISAGQELGTDGTTYYTLHFNGPLNGSGTYILDTPGRVAVEAVPIFDEGAGKISLTFTDNGQGKEYVARDMMFWGCASYFLYRQGSRIAQYTNLTLKKSYVE